MKNFAWAVFGFVMYPVAMPVILSVVPTEVAQGYVNTYMIYLEAVSDICRNMFG